MSMNAKNLIRFVDLVQGTPEWKEFRKGKIGSSMAASIRGIGFKTPLQLFEDIMEDRETPDNEAMRRGRDMEPVIRDWLNHTHSVEFKPVVVQHPTADWHISSLDGIVLYEDGRPPFVTEIKHPGRVDHEMALDGIVPEKYRMQCLHILEDIPSAEKVLYCSYQNPESVAQIWVERDEYEMPIQFAEELAFFSKLISCRPPEPTAKDWIDIYDGDALSLANEYRFLMDQLSEMEKQAEDLKKKIVEKMGTGNRAKIGDLKVQKVIRPGAVDYAKIEALNGLDLNPYRKAPITSWRLSS